MLLVAVSAFATPPGPILDGFAVETRTDAPTDARVPVAANYTPPARILAGPAAGAELAVEPVPSWGYGEYVVIAPPSGGWVAAAQYTVGVVDSGYGTTSSTGATAYELSFGVADAPAADPVAPERSDPTVEAWSEDGRYPFGCCAPTRLVTFSVDNLDPDPWSMVLLTGDLPRHPQPETLDVAVGPGLQQLSFLQWKDGSEVYPECFVVAGVAADGDRADGESVCLDEDGGVVPGCACSTRGGVGGIWVGGVVALLARRRR
jgi:hypothetical protein